MKVLIFGPSGVGKTSLLRTTCLGYSFVKVANLQPTKGISRENFIFRGLMEISIWDAGGQERYKERYFSEAQRPQVFSECDVAIFVVDATNTDPAVREEFDKFLASVKAFSPPLKNIHVLINKIDMEDAQEDAVFEMLTTDLSPENHKMCTFTPVSVKEGSAQHRLIEILDSVLQQRSLEMQRMGQIRASLDKLKAETFAEYLLFNRPDGLLISSTLGKLDTQPLKFLTFELGSLESNVHGIFLALMEMQEKTVTPLSISAVIYEAEDRYLIVREVSEHAVLMCLTNDKEPQTVPTILDQLAEKNETYAQLLKDLKWSS
jgi:small GTP-binding protein